MLCLLLGGEGHGKYLDVRYVRDGKPPREISYSPKDCLVESKLLRSDNLVSRVDTFKTLTYRFNNYIGSIPTYTLDDEPLSGMILDLIEESVDLEIKEQCRVVDATGQKALVGEIFDLSRGKIPRYSRRGVGANYTIYIKDVPAYSGQSADVFNRIAKHQSCLKNKGTFANGSLLSDFRKKVGSKGNSLPALREEFAISASLDFVSDCKEERLEFEKKWHKDNLTLISKP